MIEIYTSRHCPYCQSAKRLLVCKAVQFREIDIAANAEKLDEMVSRSGGQSMVPQIFINGQHIGDNRSLEKLNRTGQLDRMLNPSFSTTS